MTHEYVPYERLYRRNNENETHSSTFRKARLFDLIPAEVDRSRAFK